MKFKEILKELDDSLGVLGVLVMLGLVVLIIAMVVAPRETFTLLGLLK